MCQIVKKQKRNNQAFFWRFITTLWWTGVFLALTLTGPMKTSARFVEQVNATYRVGWSNDCTSTVLFQVLQEDQWQTVHTAAGAGHQTFTTSFQIGADIAGIRVTEQDAPQCYVDYSLLQVDCRETSLTLECGVDNEEKACCCYLDAHTYLLDTENPLTLSQGVANPSGGVVSPGGEAYIVNHIQLALDDNTTESIQIQGLTFHFSGNGNPDYIHHAELHLDENCDGISDGVLQSAFLEEGTMFFAPGDTIEPGNNISYIVKYMFDYEHGTETCGLISADSLCTAQTWGATLSTQDIDARQGENAVDVDGETVEGTAAPQIRYIVICNPSYSIEAGKFLDASTFEVMGAWVGLEVCNGQTEFLHQVGEETVFQISIKNGTSLGIISDYANYYGFKLSLCNNTIESHDVQRVYTLLDAYEEDGGITYCLGDELSDPYEACCLQFAGDISLEIVGHHRNWTDFKSEVLMPLRQSPNWSPENVWVKYFRRFPKQDLYYARVKVQTNLCNKNAYTLLLGAPTIASDGRLVNVVYNGE